MKRGTLMNENRFSGKADVYAKYRPAYPDGLIDYLYSDVGIKKDSIIADIGSGTGILTEFLLLRNSFVYGVEPNADMRALAEKALTIYKNFTSVDATAEKTRLADSSIDFITVAQAFHWFDKDKFKTECQRILKSGGKIILIWNYRDSQSNLVQENEIINRKYCPDFKGFTAGLTGRPDEFNSFFKNNICEHRIFKFNLVFNEESFVGRNLSSSYAPKKNDSSYMPYIAALKQLYKKYAGIEYLYMPNITRSYTGTF